MKRSKSYQLGLPMKSIDRVPTPPLRPGASVNKRLEKMLFERMADAKKMLYTCLELSAKPLSMEAQRDRTLTFLAATQYTCNNENPGPIISQILDNLHYWTALCCLINIHYDELSYEHGYEELQKASALSKSEALFNDLQAQLLLLLRLGKKDETLAKHHGEVKCIALLALADTLNLKLTTSGGVRTGSPRKESSFASSSSSTCR